MTLISTTPRDAAALRGTTCIAFVAPSATRGQRNHAKKTIGKPYAGNRTYGLKGQWGTGSAWRTPIP